MQVTVDELPFGGSPDAIDAVSRLGSQLSAGSSPAEWLEVLRQALPVPAAARAGGRRLRRDLHDGLGPTLSGIAYSADAAANLVRPEPWPGTPGWGTPR
jgi:hypothetical protein